MLFYAQLQIMALLPRVMHMTFHLFENLQSRLFKNMYRTAVNV